MELAGGGVTVELATGAALKQGGGLVDQGELGHAGDSRFHIISQAVHLVVLLNSLGLGAVLELGAGGGEGVDQVALQPPLQVEEQGVNPNGSCPYFDLAVA